jgi:hypothetical protein
MGSLVFRGIRYPCLNIGIDASGLVTNRDSSYVELFDIVADVFETTDLKEKAPNGVVQLLQKLDTWKTTLPAKPTGNVFSSERSGVIPD